MSAHAIWAPSSAHRWTVCTASAPGIAHLGEQEEGEEAAEGTRAHDELERVLKGSAADGAHPAAYGVALFADYVRQLRTTTPGDEWIEQRVRLTDDIWGRLDYGHWWADGATVTIADMKNGFVDVSAERNDQLRIYGAALIRQHNLPAKWIRYVVVQPNSFMPVPRVKQWVESADDLYAWASKVAAIPNGPMTFVAGENCKYCPLFGRCPASQDVLRDLGSALCHAPADVPPAQRALFAAMEKPIADWFKSGNKAWTKEALATQPPPGMGLFTGTTKRVWKDDAAARAAILARFGADALDPPTPAQAEKLGMTAEEVAALADKPEGGPVLAFASDKRAPWVRKSAAEMFAGVTS